MSDERVRRLEAVYARIPKVSCTGACVACCGPVVMTPLEASRTEHPNDMVALRCPKLSPLGTCTVYDRRPVVCRLYGTTPRLACDFGCVPERWLSDREVAEIVAEVEEIGGKSPSPAMLMGKGSTEFEVVERFVDAALKGRL